MQEIKTNGYKEAITALKNAILKSRYRAAALVNRELLSLYYGIGKYISENSRKGFWGTSAIDTISERLQQELPGLRGFSAGNIRKMRIFYEEWADELSAFSNCSTTTNNIQIIDDESFTNCALPTHEIQIALLIENCALPTHKIQVTSIGIILCKSQKQKTVEYAFRDMTKPMGVANYKTAEELPSKYRNILPDAEKLKELM